jgi:Holliday junction DNA helicase RuvA
LIEYLIGTAQASLDGSLILNTEQIGYRLTVSQTTLNRLTSVSGKVKVYTILNFTESGLNLYGFYDASEREMFSLLLTVSKVGPKAAMSVLSMYEPREISLIISVGDSSALSKVSGIGKKLAESIVFNLKDKVSADFSGEGQISVDLDTSAETGDVKTEAMLALTTLGFERASAVKVINACYSEGIDSASLISQALKELGNSAYYG